MIAGADFQSDRMVIVKLCSVKVFTENAFAVIRDGDEGLRVTLVFKPIQALQVRSIGKLLSKIGERRGCFGLLVDF